MHFVYLVRISLGLGLQKLNFWILLSSCFPEFLSKGDETGFSNLLFRITSSILAVFASQILSGIFQILFDILD